MKRSRTTPLRGAVALAAAAAFAATAVPAVACDLCSIYTGTLLQNDRTGFFAAASERYADFHTVREGRHRSANPDREWMGSSITQIVAGYAVTPQLAVQVAVPLVSRQYRRLEEGAPVRGHVGGLGDISFLARYTPLSRAVGAALVHVEVLAGIKTPTGNSRQLDEGQHEDEHEDHGHDSAVHGHDLALGSGSVDGVFGASLYANWKRLFADARFQYIVRGDGDHGYEYADELTWEAGPGLYLAAETNWTAAVRVIASGEDKGRDHQHRRLQEETAITAIYVGPGLEMTCKDTLQAGVAVDLPALQDVSGRQMVPDYRLRVAVSSHF